MLLAAYRFVPRQLGVDMDIAGSLEQLRSDAVATAMDGLRLENLQSLIIIAFNDVSFQGKTSRGRANTGRLATATHPGHGRLLHR